MSFEESLDIVRKLSEGRMKREPHAKVYKPASLPPPPAPIPVNEEMKEPLPGPAGADVVFVNDDL